MTSRRLYFAYGSNMDLEQMRSRCPLAKPLQVAILENHQFLINPRGVASIIEKSGSHVEGLLWDLTEACEQSLDYYEGIKEGHYVKKTIQLKDHVEADAMVYIASNQERAYAPRSGYFEKILRAAQAAGLSEDYQKMLQGYYDECQGNGDCKA